MMPKRTLKNLTKKPKNLNKQTGTEGERRAAAFLIEHEHSIISCNVRLGRLGEIDILARDPDGTIVIVEVKTRLDSTFASPEVNITPAKLRTLQQLASVIASRYPETNVRVDVIEVCTATRWSIHHLKDVLN